MKTCVIIGGGLGGLVTGALLTKEGYKVTVLEKNPIIGGGLQNFKRHGVSFPTGMHIFGGFEEGGNLAKLFGYLGVLDQLSLQPTDEDAFDVIKVAEDGAVYRMPKGKEQCIAYLSSVFPEEKDGIKAYIDKLYELTQEIDMFYMRDTQPFGLMNFDNDFIIPYNKLMDRYLTNPKLKGLLNYLCPLYSGKKETTPAFMTALLTVIHFNGTYQFVGGSQQLANALRNLIEDAGGQVLVRSEVVRIMVEDHQVTGVVTKNGNVYQADNYISGVHPDILLRLVDEGAFPKMFKKRVTMVSESISFFVVFVKLKDKSFPFLNQVNYYFDNYNDVFEPNDLQQENWPPGIIYLTPPVVNQGEFAETMVYVVPMDYEWVKPWENTHTGHRGEEYEQWKQAMMDKVFDKMEQLYPNYRDSIEFCFASTPLTIRDYFGNRRGSCYGFQKDCSELGLSQMSVFTKVKNLYLTGQNVNVHGLCGVSLTAVQTAEALVGLNTIMHKINKNAGLEK